MGYRRYRSYRYRSWDSNPPSKYSKLQSLFGEAVGEIKRQFFHLDDEAMDELLSDYGSIYGASAESYARATMPKWKTGATKLSGQTMERLIELVPPYLDAGQRLNILELILAHHEKNPITHTIKINAKEPAIGLAEIDASLAKINVTDELAYLPAKVMDAAKWLYEDDITAARAVMISIADLKTTALKQSAEREINLLKRMVESGQIKTASYTVKTPGGNLSIVVYSPSLCFVATLCFGKDDRRTQMLRDWRDDVLLEHDAGRRFVIWYYLHGEQLARILGRSRLLLMFISGILTLVAIIAHITNARRPK